MKKLKLLLVTVTAMAVLPVSPSSAQEARDIVFPVLGSVTFHNDFGAPRGGGTRTHEGNDLMGRKHQPLVSAVDGYVSLITVPQRSWGMAVFIRDDAGYTYRYIHMNNDTPGTDDGVGNPRYAFALDIQRGAPVVKGQLIGWMGDSGNAESTQSHVHFEIQRPDGTPMNPYPSLVSAPRLTTPADYPALPYEFLPYGRFSGGARISAGNLDDDPETIEIVTGAGPGGGPHVRTFSEGEAKAVSFFPYSSAFRGGVDVALGDIDGDGVDEIITGAGPGGGPHVRMFESDGTPMGGGFFAYKTTFGGGVKVAAGDVDGDGVDEIITGPGRGGGPHVRVFTATGTAVDTGGFMAYNATFRGGIDVAAGDLDADGDDEIITGPGEGGGPHVRVFDGDGSSIGPGFMAYDSAFRGGVNVDSANVKVNRTWGDEEPQPDPDEIVTGPGYGGGPDQRIFDSSGSKLEGGVGYFESWWIGGIDVAAATDYSLVASGPGRRASVREGHN